MAYSINRMQEHDLFVQQMHNSIPGVKAYVSIRGWEDPRPEFVVQFKNGVVFESDSKHRVINAARAYHEATLRLTGEAP